MPSLIVIAGPNGAGKSTAAEVIVRRRLGVSHFVNADTIARGLSAYDPESAAMAAGRIMLERLRELAASRADFAFETTLASRTFAPWIDGLRRDGYAFYLRYLWVPGPELSIARVAGRVRQGGHHVPDVDIVRRYRRSLSNLMQLYLPIADDWVVYDNTLGERREIAEQHPGEGISVYDEEVWESIRRIGDGRER